MSKENLVLAETEYNLGKSHHEKGRLREAITFYKKALRRNPNYIDAYYSLGTALKEKGKLKAAIDSYQKALRINPNFPNIHYSLGNALKEQGKITSAIESYKTAIFLQNDHADANWNLSLVLLLSGNYKSGLESYEWRWKKMDASRPHAYPKSRRWEGINIKSSGKLLIISEQGLGDTIQFMRYVPFLREEGVEILFCAQQVLHGLIKESEIHLNPLTPSEANEVSGTNWIPLLSLPRYLDISPKNPIINTSYISTKKELVSKWGIQLSKEIRPLIGINWQGNPNAEKMTLKGRSFPLETLSNIAKESSASFVSLQKGFGSEQLESCSFKDMFVSCQDRITKEWDFLETSAIIENCDLIITSDSCIAHLAGGIGKETWLLLKDVPDWRWEIDSQKSFWYQSMKLFRQQERSNWNEVMTRVKKEYKKFLANYLKSKVVRPTKTILG